MDNQQQLRLIGTNLLAAKPAKGVRARFKRWLQVHLANWLFADEPLIWTKYGNMPEASLEHVIEWGRSDTHIACVRSFKYKGEEVKREPHIMLLAPSPIGDVTQGSLQ